MGVDWQSKGRGSRSDAIRFPWRRHLPSPPPSHRIEGGLSQFFPMFSFHGVCLADGDTDRKRFKVPRTGWCEWGATLA